MDKLQHRQLMKDKLSKIDEEQFLEKSFLISKNLSQLLSDLNVIQKKNCIGAFASFEKEPRLGFLLTDEVKGLTAYPAFDVKKNVMTYKLANFSELIEKKEFGPKILGPKLEATEVIPDVILIPGIVFSESGERIGRGKGFYDKYLANYRGIKIGLCFSLQVTQSLPTERHDVALDYIVTEEKIIKCH